MKSVTVGPESVNEHGTPTEAAAAVGTTWITLDVTDTNALETVRTVFDVHSLSIEDVQRGVPPKTEAYPDHTFVLVSAARLRREESTFEEELVDAAVGLFIGEDWLITITTGEPNPVPAVRARLESGDTRAFERGPDFLAYRIIDSVVDEYFALLDGLEDRIERIEEAVTDDPDRSTLEDINAARRELLSVRKLLWPTREAVGVLARGDPEQIDEETEKYFRDVHDHLIQQVDLVQTYRDLVTGARDIYLTVLSMSTNEVMKRLTVVATIVLPMTVVVGVYGMNFETMPELAWQYGYPAVLLGMLGMSAILIWYFRREDWL